MGKWVRALESLVAQVWGRPRLAEMHPGARESVFKSLNLLSDQSIGIVGGSGFVGKALLSALSQVGSPKMMKSVQIFSRSAPPSNLDCVYKGVRVTWQSCDITQGFAPNHPPDVLVLAATPSSQAIQRAAPLALVDNVVVGARNVLRWAEKRPVAPLVLNLSSGAVYGAQASDREAFKADDPGCLESFCASHAYAESKRIAETMMAIGHEQGLITALNVRLFAFIGPNLPRDSHFAAGNFLRDAENQRAIEVIGDGSAMRSFLYEADLAAWLLAALSRRPVARSLNIGSSRSCSIGELASIIGRISKCAVLVRGETDNSHGRYRYLPETGVTKATLGVEEWTSLEQSIRWSLPAEPKEE